MAMWKAPTCREMTTQGIQKLVNELTKHLRCLMALDKDPYASPLPGSEVLMPALKEKFPPALQKAWDRKVAPDSLSGKRNRSPPQWRGTTESTRMRKGLEAGRHRKIRFLQCGTWRLKDVVRDRARSIRHQELPLLPRAARGGCLVEVHQDRLLQADGNAEKNFNRLRMKFMKYFTAALAKYEHKHNNGSLSPEISLTAELMKE
ncbi:hypothetical protein T10_12868 [Trichinella papuae]|uniref:Uncharacterized protein n=1 Tax=Trichinella papuae TaxID=268474 RepID=A0A0V1M0X6_9BILA|nr:hypothetical protein T10_12868 [Trichinella papuae]